MPTTELVEIRCKHCGTLFGIESPDGILHIKLKDLYRDIEGRVEGPCRRCTMKVVWPDEPTVLVVERGG